MVTTCFACSYFEVLNWCRRNDFAVNPDDEACRFYIGINMEEAEINKEEEGDDADSVRGFIVEKEEQEGGIYVELEEEKPND